MPGPETLPPEPRRSDSVPVLGLRGLATSALALPAVPAVAADRSPTSLVLAAVAVGVGGGAAWWTSRRSGPPRPLLAVLGALLVVVAGWLLPQADVSVITVLIGFGVGVGAGLGGGALGVLRRPEAAIGTAVGLAVLAALVAVDGVHGTAWAGLLDGVAIAGIGVLSRSRPRTGAPGSVRVCRSSTRRNCGVDAASGPSSKVSATWPASPSPARAGVSRCRRGPSEVSAGPAWVTSAPATATAAALRPPLTAARRPWPVPVPPAAAPRSARPG